MSTINQALFDQYNRDSRRKTPSTQSTYCADDRGPLDFASDKSVYGSFCEVIVDSANDPTIDVRLIGNVPVGPEVEAWVKENGAIMKQAPRHSLEFSVAPGEEGKLLDLAAAIAIITSRRYDTRSYKYACPRTANSLRRLAAVLASARGA